MGRYFDDRAWPVLPDGLRGLLPAHSYAILRRLRTKRPSHATYPELMQKGAGMELIRRLVPALATICCVVVSPAILGQTAQSVRPAVDVRSMLPSVAEPAAAAPPTGTGLTRNQRKDQALKAREEGALKPAGEGAELREDTASKLAAKSKAEPSVAVAEPPPVPAPAPMEASVPPKKVAASSTRAPKRSTIKVAAAGPRPATRKATPSRDPSKI
jgi:hypothetical protein